MKQKLVFNLIILVLATTLFSIDQTFTIDQPTLLGIRDACDDAIMSEPLINYLWNESRTTREYTPEEIQMLGNRYYADYFDFEENAFNSFRGIIDYAIYFDQMNYAINYIQNFDVDNFTISIFDPDINHWTEYAQYDMEYPGNIYDPDDDLTKNLTPYMRGRHLAYGLNFFAFTVDMAYYYMGGDTLTTALAKVDSLADWTYDNLLDPENWSNGRWDFDIGWCEIDGNGLEDVMPKIGSQSSNITGSY